MYQILTSSNQQTKRYHPRHNFTELMIVYQCVGHDQYKLILCSHEQFILQTCLEVAFVVRHYRRPSAAYIMLRGGWLA